MVFGIFQNQARAQGKVDPVTSAARQLTRPGAEVSSWAAQGANDVWTGLQKGPTLARENERLKGEISALRIYQAMAADAVAQLNAIQSLDTIPLAPGASMVKGRVIGYWPNEHRLTLNVGSNDGVEANRAVVAPEGLAGVVDTVSPDSCQVLLITSASTRVGGKIVRDVTTFGLIRGLTYESLGMEVKRDSPVETGDRVVTSGISEWILGGLPVGEVTQITPRPEFGTKLLVLFPGFKVSAGRYLGVLK